MDLTEEQQMIYEMAKKFADSEVAPRAHEMDQTGEFDMELLKKAGELGLMGISVPPEDGGTGIDTVCMALVMEQVARADGATCLTLAAHNGLGCWPLHKFGTPEQKEKYLRPACLGEKIAAFALSEADSGSDAAALKTVAVRDGDSYVVNGRKLWCTNGAWADYVVVAVLTDQGARGDGVSALIVDAGTPGFSIGKVEDKLGLKASNTAELVLEDVRVPAENLLGKENEGFGYFLQTLDGGRISIGAMALGLAQGAYEHALRYSSERKQFDKPLASFQAIRWKLADMATRIHAARLMVHHAARKKDRGEDFQTEASMAKLFASEMAMEVTNDAIQIYGGYGYMKEYPLERMYRDAKLCEIGEGTSEVQRLVISRNVLKDV
jgi:butyryl-CoA dehydrogenase